MIKYYFRALLISAVLLLSLAGCEGSHEVIETDWTTLESVELQDQYNKYMDGDWVYQYDDTVHFIEMNYKFNVKDSTVTTSGSCCGRGNSPPSGCCSTAWTSSRPTSTSTTSFTRMCTAFWPSMMSWRDEYCSTEPTDTPCVSPPPSPSAASTCTTPLRQNNTQRWGCSPEPSTKKNVPEE